jgi:hypothetical protein
MRMFLATLLTAAAVAAPTTGPASNLSASGATLNGTVDGPATSVHFEYGTTTAYGLATTPQLTVPAGPVSATISGLTAETTYHYRIVADGEVGNDQTFTTTANPLPPGVTDQRAREIGPESALATASVNANGNATTYVIEYGTTTRYGSRTTAAPAGSAKTATTVSARLTDLRPYTRYHWRTVATNAAGTTRGRDRSFRTARLPSSVSIGVSRRTAPWGGEVRLGGRVSGAGVSGMTVRLEQQRFPFDQDFTQLSTARTGSDGGYLFTVASLYATTRYRVSTSTQVVATSPVATVRSAVKVGARARHYARRRASVEGTVVPGVHGTATLQRYRPRVGWRTAKAKTVAPADELRTRYRFIVWRPRKRRPAIAYRVVMTPVRGAQVRGKSRAVTVRPRSRR